jgi:hypothetical protein
MISPGVEEAFRANLTACYLTWSRIHEPNAACDAATGYKESRHVWTLAGFILFALTFFLDLKGSQRMSNDPIHILYRSYTDLIQILYKIFSVDESFCTFPLRVF